jgi:signal peptidase I
MNEPAQRPEAPHSLAVTVFEYAEVFVLALCTVMLLFGFVVQHCTVRGPSMDKTLADGEHLLVSPLLWEPEPGDIVVFHQTGGLLNEAVIKRLIALPGQTVEIDFNACTLKVDGVLVEEDYRYLSNGVYTRHADYNTVNGVFTVTVPEGYWFVLGDNRMDSKDSRSPEIGLIDKREVLGKAVFLLYPGDPDDNGSAKRDLGRIGGLY